ncbi:hypothetical protein DFP74_4573 [Nocardiopsis sp. Huas11]|uniref:hypothetical protein n=1 Tax=Nocardiopsis sp. Huas11 TaxID=2183912 RepID=UPI000F139763|nr:hypothetical protein [Nocardiopsis sp. Huas11]RKS08850.1 hypothetical protein DFP74_4573 [Nocardiopsis sp. Huas11]
MAPASSTASPHAPEGLRTLLVPWSVLAWSAALMGVGLGWLAGVLPRGVPDTDGFGSLFIGQSLGTASAAAIGVGAAGVVVALLLLRRGGAGGRPAEVAAWAMAAVVLLVFVDGSLLVLFGYSMMLPFVGWFVPGLFAMWIAAVLEPTSLTLLFCALGTALWVVAALTHSRARRRACQQCGRHEQWSAQGEREVRSRATVVGRWAVAVGVVLALLYPALRFPWLFGLAPGMSEESAARVMAEPGTVLIGVGLGATGAVGAVLMLGLVQRWGVRFPRWMVGLAGRRVPVSLAVVPAALVSMALMSMGRSVIVQLASEGQVATPLVEDLHSIVFVLMAPWGVALAVATAAYAMRRRAECALCERGLPEVVPGRTPAARV